MYVWRSAVTTRKNGVLKGSAVARQPQRQQQHLCYSTTNKEVTIPDDAIHFAHVVIGGGVVGLSVAARLGKEAPTLLLEKNGTLGEEVSSRNSEVIHAGLYYPAESLKTKLCIQGRHMLYKTCEQAAIPFNNIGKWVISQNEDESEYLEQIHAKAKSLGVPTHFIPKSQHAEEPNVKAHTVLISSSTGIVNSHALMHYLESAIETSPHENSVIPHTKVTSIQKHSKGYLIEALSGEGDAAEKCLINADSVINCAGLYADTVAEMVLKDKMPKNYRQYYCKGSYFAYTGKPLVKHLIYPVPEKNLKGLGVHVTLDLAGHMRFGPDAFYIDRDTQNAWAVPDYSVTDQQLDEAHKAIIKYLPMVTRERLYTDYSGVRPKLSGPGEPFRDFLIEEETSKGFPGLVNLIGIESPGLTSSLAIAEHVAGLLRYSPSI